jgi:rod shape-determining protein MreC
VVGGLVLLSLVLITVSFRSTKLDPVESAAASALRPFEVAAERVSRPFRDAVGWTSGLIHAKRDNERLRKENEALRRQAIVYESALQQNVELQNALQYKQSPTAKQFDVVAAEVIANPPSRFEQQIVIAAGKNDGIDNKDVVVTPDGLVGQVTKVFARVARVTLITDETSAVRARDLTDPAAVGILRHGSSPDTLVLDRVANDKSVQRGDVIVTAGSPPDSELRSMFPRDIEIGMVSSVSLSDTESFMQIQVQPRVDLSSLQSVLVLVPKTRH